MVKTVWIQAFGRFIEVCAHQLRGFTHRCCVLSCFKRKEGGICHSFSHYSAYLHFTISLRSWSYYIFFQNQHLFLIILRVDSQSWFPILQCLHSEYVIKKMSIINWFARFVGAVNWIILCWASFKYERSMRNFPREFSYRLQNVPTLWLINLMISWCDKKKTLLIERAINEEHSPRYCVVYFKTWQIAKYQENN